MSNVVPPLAPASRPVVGHALIMKNHPGDFLTSLQNGEGVNRIKMGRSDAYVVNDPELIRELLRDSSTFVRGGPVMDKFRTMFGNGLGISVGEFHRKQRSIIQPAFHHKRIEPQVAVMSELTREHCAHWRDGGYLRFDHEMDELALRQVAKLLFRDQSGVDFPRFMQDTTIMLNGLFKRLSDPTGVMAKLPTADNRRYEDATSRIREAVFAVISSYRRQGVDHGDLLSMMMHATNDDGRPAMSDDDLYHEVLTFFVSGSNTTSNTLSWAFYEISQRPAVEAALHAEVDQVVPDGEVRYEHVADLELTRRIVSETLRYRTQGLFLNRVTSCDTELGGYHLPRGATIFYSFHALNRNASIHARPEEFDPDRWLPERAASIPRGAFMPFSTGVHGCIGDQFAWTEMVTMMATVAARWRLFPARPDAPRPVPALTMPVDSLPMVSVHRSASH